MTFRIETLSVHHQLKKGNSNETIDMDVGFELSFPGYAEVLAQHFKRQLGTVESTIEPSGYNRQIGHLQLVFEICCVFLTHLNCFTGIHV